MANPSVKSDVKKKTKSILISQPQPNSDSSPYFEIEKKRKVQIDFKPFINVEGVTAREVRKQKIDFNKFTAIILTSRKAVDHFFRLAEEMRYHIPDAMKYFCQSEAIAYYLQKYIVYRKRKVFIGLKDFNDLHEILLKNKNEKYLLPASDALSEEIPKIMDSGDLNWKKAILYRTVCSDLSELKSVKYDMIVFFSPSGIKSLFENFPYFKQNDTSIAVFGKSTYQKALNANLKVTIQAPTTKYPSMAMAIDDFLKN